MNLLAAALGFFVHKPIIASRLKRPAASVVPEPVLAQSGMPGPRRAAGP